MTGRPEFHSRERKQSPPVHVRHPSTPEKARHHDVAFPQNPKELQEQNLNTDVIFAAVRTRTTGRHKSFGRGCGDTRRTPRSDRSRGTRAILRGHRNRGRLSAIADDTGERSKRRQARHRSGSPRDSNRLQRQSGLEGRGR